MNHAWFRRIAGFLGLALLLTSAVFASSATAAPQGPWLLPADKISGEADYEGDSSVAYSPDGSATAVWVTYYEGSNTNEVVTATKPPGGSFGPVTSLSTTTSDARSVQIDIGSDGSAAAVWRFTDGPEILIQASTRPPGGNFGPAVDISTEGEVAVDPEVAVGPDGEATVVWAEIESSEYMIASATGTSAGGFTPAADLSEAGETNELPQVATGTDGTTVAVWKRWNGSTYRIQAATRPPDGSFGDATDISTDGKNSEDPRVVVDPGGTATAVWRAYNGSNQEIERASSLGGGDFGTPVRMSGAGLDSWTPGIAVGADGTEVVTWRGQSANVGGFIVQASVRPPGGSFGVPAEISEAGLISESYGASVGPDGTVSALWFVSDGDDDRLVTATRPPGGAFGERTVLSTLPFEPYSAEIAIGPLNEAVAVWDVEEEGFGVYAASTELPLLAVDVTRTGTGSGTVTSNPAGITCDGSGCSGGFPGYSQVTLTATPDSGSTFSGWTGACAGNTGTTCSLTMLEAKSAGVAFTAPAPPAGKATLKITRFAPKKPKVKKNKVLRIKVTAKNTGKATAGSVKLCVKPTKKVKKALKPEGKACFKLGTLGAGKSKTKTFKLKSTGKAKKGRQYKLNFALSAKGVKTAKGAVRAKVV